MKSSVNNFRKLVSKGALLALIVAGAVAPRGEAALTKSFYKANSLLSDGNWVKIGVEKTGVYEISYQALREMGFANPEKVAVFGRGGRVLPESFVSSSGIPVLSDDISAVGVIHDAAEQKLYFYGLGPEEINFESKDIYPSRGYFTRKSNNIYTRRGYYFLTDSETPVEMPRKSYGNPESMVTSGVSFIYHEKDLEQNTTNSGQLFWGEHVGYPGEQKIKWEVEIPGALPGEKNGVMECHLYFQDRSFGSDASVSYGFEEGGSFTTPYTINNSLYYAPHTPTIQSIGIPKGEKGNVFVEFKGIDMGTFSNLDFWVVSYKSEIPKLEKESQRLLALPEIESKETKSIVLENCQSMAVLDVTTPSSPAVLPVTMNGAEGFVNIYNNGQTPQIVVFDKEKPQLKISGYETGYSKVTNQNLHALKTTGADFIIITTPRFREYAEEIAELHRHHDGITVVVATTEEIYNEFSAGVPDPMAYRSFAKMLYFHDTCKPKNILLFGPLHGDFRGIQTEHDPFEGIIAYQSPSISISRGAHNINDFYGMMDDKFRTDYYERNNVQVGVGILPVKFDSDARIVVEKIKNYLERDDQAYWLNKLTAMSGLGDSHTHDSQILEIFNHLGTLDFHSTIYTPLSIDSYGNREANKKFISQLNEGCGIFTYFGHGAEQFLGKDHLFFSAGDVYKLRNTVLPLAGFGGCQITNSDRGFRGLGETIVTSTPYGCIGTIVSSRDTWSGQNLEFFKQFFICLYKQGSTATSAHRSSPATIGEIYAKVKHYSTYSNELAYQLMCDPALVVPTANRNIEASFSARNVSQGTIVPGEKLSVKGSVKDADGKTDKSFNGKAVIRLCEPERRIQASATETGDGFEKELVYPYRDSQLTMATAEVKNGEFSLEILAPASLASFMKGTSQNISAKPIVYLSAYDGSTRTGAASSYELPMETNSSLTAENADKTPPVIENLLFDEDECAILLTVSDNLALNLSTSPLSKGLYLYIDGKENTVAHFIEPKVEADRAAYSKNIPLEGLSYGEHNARLKVKDVAGNEAQAEILFTYQPRTPKYSIERSEESDRNSTVVTVSGATPGKASLVVLTSQGNEIWRGDFNGARAEWNHVDFSGAPVAPGHYKGYMIETGSGTVRSHSQTIDIPVI